MSFRRTGKAQAPQQEEKKQEAPKSNKSSSSQGSSGKPTYHNDVLTIMKNNKTGSAFLVFDSKTDVEIFVNGKKVTKLLTKDTMESLQDAVEAGRISEERAEELADKMQNILAKVTLVCE